MKNPEFSRRTLPAVAARAHRSLLQLPGAGRVARSRKQLSCVLAVIVLLIISPLVSAQDAAGAPPRGGGRRGGGGGGGPRPAIDNIADYTGFVSIFDGTLKNWDGPTNFFDIQDGAIHARAAGVTTYLIWTGGTVKDFELKMDIKLTSNINAGIQYRSRRTAGIRGASDGQNKAIADLETSLATLNSQLATARTALLTATFAEPPDPAGLRAKMEAVGTAELSLANARASGLAVIQGSANKLNSDIVQILAQQAGRGGGGRGGGRGGAYAQWDVAGYQFDMDYNNRYTGMLYEQSGRSIVTQRGDIGILPATGRGVTRIGLIGDGNLTQYIKQDDFNTYHLIARGNVLTHIINGHVMSVTFDENPALRALEGIIAFEIEANGEAFVKNAYLKNLGPN